MLHLSARKNGLEFNILARREGIALIQRSVQEARTTDGVAMFSRTDWLSAALFFAISFGLRVPFRSQYAYHWDSAQFALAMHQYNIGLSLPHRPGYFLYVMMGRAVNLVVGDPHASLVWMSVFAGAALVSLGYLLGAALFGRGCGWAAAAILATSPLCWFQSEIALTPIVDSALVTATILVCWRAIGRGGGWRWIVVMAVLFAMVAGVRQQTAPSLLPIWFFTFSRFPRPRWRKFVFGILLAGLGCALWFIPFVRLSGGLNVYLGLTKTTLRPFASLTTWGGGVNALIDNICLVIAGCWSGLLLAGVIAGVELWLLAFGCGREEKQRFVANYRNQLLFLTLWSAPLVTFYLAFWTTMPGHVLSYFPAMAILAGLAVHKSACRIAGACDPKKQVLQHQLVRRGWILTLAAVMVLNCVIFLFRPPILSGLLLGLDLTAPDIRTHDRQLSAWFTAVRLQFRPEQVLICHYGEVFLWNIRQFQYHLPEYENCLLTQDRALVPPFDKKIWYTKNRRVEFEDWFDAHGKQTLVLIVPPGKGADLFAKAFDISHAKRWEINGSAPLYTMEVGLLHKPSQMQQDGIRRGTLELHSSVIVGD
jgi:hypothetical protein